MTDSFGALKRNRAAGLSQLSSEISKLTNNPQTQNGPDDRFWKPEVDKAGNGYAVIRFLPEPSGETVPFVRVWDHGFQGPGGWYIENSLTTLGSKDPVSEYNSMLWNSGLEANKEKARKQKRRLSFISNIYVVKDPSHPENEGKVFLYKYGKKIFDKLNEAMNPQFEDESPVNPFDLWEGADFKLKIRNVEGYRNYDKSELDVRAPLSEDDEKLESIWKSEHSLAEFTDAKNFKTFEELQSKLNRVLGLDGGASKATAESSSFSGSVQAKSFKEVPAAVFVEQDQDDSIPFAVDDDDDDTLDFFKKLAAD